MKVAALPYKLANQLRKLYWRLLKPQTFGVRVVIRKNDDPDKILILRHTYGNTAAWNVSGGGYKPQKETPEAAAAREVREETNLSLTNLKRVGEYRTAGEGKRDVVSLFSATATADNPVGISGEIAEIQWADKHSVLTTHQLAHAAQEAIKASLHS